MAMRKQKPRKKMSFGNDSIIFSIPENFFEKNLSKGGVLQVEFKSGANSALNCRLFNKLVYKSSEQISEKDSSGDFGSRGSGGGGATSDANSQNNGAYSPGVVGLAAAATGEILSGIGNALASKGILRSVNRDSLKKAILAKDKKGIKNCIEQARKLDDIEGLEEILKTATEENADIEIKDALKKAILELKKKD